MAKKKQSSNSPRGNAAANKSSSAGKRSERTAGAAAQTAPPKTPTTTKSTEKSGGQKSKSSGAVKERSRKNGLFKFRRYNKLEGGKDKKAKHPKLIVEQEKNTVGFMGLTEDDKSGHHKNIPLRQNPKKGDKRKAYIRKELRYDTLDNFGEILDSYNLSKTDKQEIIKFLEKRKKKK